MGKRFFNESKTRSTDMKQLSITIRRHSRLTLLVLSALFVSGANAAGYGQANPADVNPGLYPPLSTGEASPWEEPTPKTDPQTPGLATGNPWGAAAATPAPSAPESSAYGAYKSAPQVNTPYYGGYYPYQTVPQGYMVAPQTLLPAPYGYATPYVSPYGYPGGYGAPLPFSNNNGFNPFNFSFPMPF